ALYTPAAIAGPITALPWGRCRGTSSPTQHRRLDDQGDDPAEGGLEEAHAETEARGECEHGAEAEMPGGVHGEEDADDCGPREIGRDHQPPPRVRSASTPRPPQRSRKSRLENAASAWRSGSVAIATLTAPKLLTPVRPGLQELAD